MSIMKMQKAKGFERLTGIQERDMVISAAKGPDMFFRSWFHISFFKVILCQCCVYSQVLITGSRPVTFLSTHR